MEDPCEMRVLVELQDDDPGRFTVLLEGLRDDLLDLPVHAAHLATSEPPADAKSGTGLALGTLVVSGAFSATTLHALARIVIAWIQRTGVRRVTLSSKGNPLVLEGLSARDQRAVIDTWIAQELNPQRAERSYPESAVEGGD
jgi:hypothetical protein